MFRFGFRLLRSAEVSAKPTTTTATVSPFANYPTHIQTFFEGKEVLPQAPVLPENPTKQQIDKSFDDLIRHPIISRDPQLAKVYSDSLIADKSLENYDPLPGVSSDDTPINWSYYKKLLPVQTVDHFKAVYENTLKELDSWKIDHQKFVNYASKKLEEESRDSAAFTSELKLAIADIEKQMAATNTFIENLDKITFAEMEGKFPEIEEEIYHELENSEWMVKDKVGDNTIWNAVKHTHH